MVIERPIDITATFGRQFEDDLEPGIIRSFSSKAEKPSTRDYGGYEHKLLHAEDV